VVAQWLTNLTGNHTMDAALKEKKAKIEREGGRKETIK